MSAEVNDDDGEKRNPMKRDTEQRVTPLTEVPKIDFSSNSDLMSRLSSFLPQLHAANVDLVNNTENKAVLQIDRNMLIGEDGEEEEEDDENDSENDDCVIKENDDIVHISLSSNKRRKHDVAAVTKPSTIVMDIHVNQDINDPLFKALVDKSSETDDEDDIDTNEQILDSSAERAVHLPSLILPHNLQKPTAVSKGGGSKLIEELND
jgi:hypothetical protein